ncbi:MAG: PspC domain-containing protein [Nocardioides sp.]|uniref:PspC domain-containing protein n=1 Tax=Nocardioides sp. TaxID=35761 RepID=UPI0039E63C5C
MSTTETPPEAPGPRVTRDEVKDLGRLVRTSSASPENRYVAGVAGGIARHLDIDPILVRIALVVGIFFGGAGLVVYGAGWLFMPDEEDGDAMIAVDQRSRNVVLWVAAGMAVLAVVGDVVGGLDFPHWIIPTFVIVAVGVWLWDRRHGRHPSPDERTTQTLAAIDAAEARTREALAAAAATSDVATAAAYERAQLRTERALTRARERVTRAQQRRSSKRGPLLFWFTLALVALAEGTLGVIDGAGASVVAPAYPALALGIIGAMLVLGAFWGRAGGLILIGLITSAVLGVSTAAHEWGVDGGHYRSIEIAPASTASVEDDYTFRTGDFELDLTQVSDPRELGGRTIHVDGRLGQIVVRVPAGLDVSASAHVSGPGAVEVLGSEDGGIGQSRTVHSVGTGATLTIDADLRVGHIQIVEE